jgi:tetratricopeptide (TPR) repeat protein
LARAVAKADAGDLGGAISDLDRAIALNPAYAEAYFNRGSLRYSQGHLDQAIADFDKAIQINPKLTAAYDNRGCAKKDKGDLEEAIRDFNEALKLDPKDTVALVNRARACAFDRPTQALDDFNAALLITPKDGALYFERGALNRVRRDYKAACNDFLLAIQNGCKDSEAYASAGSMQSYLRDDAAALAVLNDGITANPDNAGLYYQRAGVRLAVAKLDSRALYDYTNKDDAMPQPALQCLQQAIDDCTRAIKIQPRYADAYQKRADLFCAKHAWTLAIADYTNVLALAPRSIQAYSGRALAREKVGEADAAAVDRRIEEKLRSDMMRAADDLVRKANEVFRQVQEQEKRYMQLDKDMQRAQEQAQKAWDDMRQREQWNKIMENANKTLKQERIKEETLRNKAEAQDPFTPPNLPVEPEPSGK